MSSLGDGFGAVVGHAQTIARLRAARTRLATTYLFHGEEGIGKRTVARMWIRLLQCASPIGGEAGADACGDCPSCRRHAAGTHPDFVCLEPETTVITVDQVRAMQAALPFHPLCAPRRAVLIPEASALNPEAANALLKTLEEPPVHTLFVLITAQRERLLATLVSRCQPIRFSVPGQEPVLAALTERMGLAPERARMLFIHAQGRIGAAIHAAETVLKGSPASEMGFEDIASPATVMRPARLLDIAEGVAKDQQALKTLLVWVGLWLRDVLVWQCCRDPGLVLHPDREADLTWWAEQLSTDDVLELGSGLHRLWVSVHRNLNPQLVAEVLLLNILKRITASGENRGRRVTPHF